MLNMSLIATKKVCTLQISCTFYFLTICIEKIEYNDR